MNILEMATNEVLVNWARKTDLYSEQSVAQHPSVIQTADINLATEIEGLKLDFVIIESKTARDLEANKQAIEQLQPAAHESYLLS